jgi:outer membrane protein OmpA-like peptidoglycan-associated protein
MRKITLALITIAAMLPLASMAQRYMGIATSNWSGTNGLYLNPANIADSRHKFTVDLFSLNFGLDNNLATLNFSEAVKASGDFADVFSFSNKDQFSILAPTVELRLPGFMVSLGSKHAIALTTRVRAMNQFHNFNQNLYKLVNDSNSTDLTQGQRLKAENFNWTANAWTEVGLTYGGVIYDKGEHMLKGGITARYMMGAAYISVLSKNIDAAYNYIPGADATLTLTNTDFQYRQSGANGILNGELGDFLGKNVGKGIGADLGIVYEWRPKHEDYRYDMDGKTGILDNSKNKYLLRFSAAITDLGSIKYSNSSNLVFNTNSVTPSVVKGTEIADFIDDTAALSNYLTLRGMTATRGSGETKVGMPTMMVIGVDYHALKNVYVNATYMGNVATHTKPGNTFYSQFTVTPRYDTRIFSVGVPITYSALSSSLKAGVGVRVGGFFLGSDDVFAFGNRYSANFYMGAYVPINKRKPKDNDGDGVSNKRDKCRNEKGVWEMKGCPNPDKDGDGVLDKDDLCPDVAGSKTANGCPDADMDGVADAEDRCPEAAGPAGMQGCPDRDGDGVADIDDVCPDQPGLAQFKGCPDTDNDGIADNEDKCPTLAGPVANQGCPDSDNDGVADNIDKCPTVPGTVANSGCPEVSVEVKKRLAFAATAIQFETGKAAIKKTSNKILDEIVKILNDYPDYNMSIEGHSDNVGNAAKNMQLSKERANSVKNYFVAKGIASNRLSAEGFGDTKPVESNKTAAGRAKNRRVAMDLKLKD